VSLPSAEYAIDDILRVRAGQLWIEECDSVALARQFGTPLYVISENQLRRNVRAIREAFSRHWRPGKVQILPSVKANYLLALWRILSDEGAGCDTFGAGELYAALAARVPAKLISVNGSAKDSALIETAVMAGARITIDSAAELDLVIAVAARLGKRATIRLRVRPDYDGLDEASDLVPDRSIKAAAQMYKPGIASDVASRLGATAIEHPRIDLSGLMVHLGRHSAQIAVWEKMAASFASLVARLSREWGGWRPKELDIGGGFATRRDPTSPARQPAPPIDALAEAIVRSLRDGLIRSGMDLSEVTLEVEPGRLLFADTGIHLATVRHIKVQQAPVQRQWVETDTTEMFLPDLLIERARFMPIFASKASSAKSAVADLVGISCGFDILAEHIPVPDLAAGDIIAFLDIGAYQDAASANFNAMPRPGTVLVSADKAEWIKRPETIADVFARDSVPERLA